MDNKEIIEAVQNGESVPFAKIYIALENMPKVLVNLKRKEKKYSLPELEWELLTDAATDGLIKAIQKYEYKKNNDIQGWAWKIMEQQFNKKLNTIIKKRMREQELEDSYLFDQENQEEEQTLELKKKTVLNQRDYALLEYIISCNNKKDLHGKPFCPNSTNIINRGQFQNLIKSRTTLSECIRKLKDAGYRFAEKEDRDSNQGYFILNPELYNNITIEEKLALDFLEQNLPSATDDPILNGIQLLTERLKRDYELPQNGKPLILEKGLIEIEKQNPGIFSPAPLGQKKELFERCIQYVTNKAEISIVYKNDEGNNTCISGKAQILKQQNNEWKIQIQEMNKSPVWINISQILEIMEEE